MAMAMALALAGLLSLAAAQPSGSLAWSWNAGGSTNSVEASPALLSNADNTTTLFIATYGGSVSWLHASDGSTTGLPSFYEGEMIRSTPVVHKSRAGGCALYFMAGDAKLYALDCATAAVLWAFATGEKPDEFQSSSPCVYDSGSGGDALVYVGSVDGHVRAVNAAAGTLAWAFATAGPIYSSPAVTVLPNGTAVVLCGSDDGAVYALSAATGALLWSFQTGDFVRGSFAFATIGGAAAVLFGSNDFTAYALDAVSGAVLWRFKTGGAVYATPTTHVDAAGALSVFIGSYDYNVYALDGATGTPRWNFTTLGYVVASPTVIASGGAARVYVGCDQTLSETLFYAIDARTGALAWTYFVENAPIWSSARAVLENPAGPIVVFGAQDGNVWALDLP